ncbi:glucose 1-dehydrogenase [Streptomyces sp. JJ36]|uniref:glucose 1-dehydrogenase n=1 Tax=Streptomyces sp. JJ36 TaxID=2736645 RepID=UPI001F3FF734|nr:glucose 1-dehydrogenase [Streptomyces sp. JJ36]MCF6525367.1 glucose 1-dehydrogenase [Streptomyces sp. JJ36]
MRALTTLPGRGNTLRLETLPDPEPGPGELLVEGLAVGVCGTDRSIAAGEHGSAPPGRERLIIGHESLGRVRRAPASSGFAAGDLVVGLVRRPDPVPCGACAHGSPDMCRNGRYTECGIKERDGYAATLWTVDPAYTVRLPPGLERTGALLEPASVVAKAWDQVGQVGARSWFAPASVLVTGAGPIGLLAALLGRHRGLEVHVLDRTEHGPKPRLVRELGAEYHTDEVEPVLRRLRPDVVIEATGAAPVALGAMGNLGAYGVLCLTGLSSAGRTVPIDAGALNRELVLDNAAVIGSVNAHRDHYAAAAAALAGADADWLERVLDHRLPVDRFREAFGPRRRGGVKTVLELTADGSG